MGQKAILLSKMPIRTDFQGAEAEKSKIVKHHPRQGQDAEVIGVLISETCKEIQLLEQRRKAQLAKETRVMEWLKKGEGRCPM